MRPALRMALCPRRHGRTILIANGGTATGLPGLWVRLRIDGAAAAGGGAFRAT